MLKIKHRARLFKTLISANRGFEQLGPGIYSLCNWAGSPQEAQEVGKLLVSISTPVRLCQHCIDSLNSCSVLHASSEFVRAKIEILLFCCAVSVQAHSMKLSVQQTYKSIWLSSAYADSLLIHRFISWALCLTMGRGSTLGTSPIERSTHYGWKKASGPPLVALWSQQETTLPFHCQFFWKFLDALWGFCSLSLGCRWHLLVVGLPLFWAAFQTAEVHQHLLLLTLLLKRANRIRNLFNNDIWALPQTYVLVETLCHQPGSDFLQLLHHSSPCICVLQSPYLEACFHTL